MFIRANGADLWAGRSADFCTITGRNRGVDPGADHFGAAVRRESIDSMKFGQLAAAVGLICAHTLRLPDGTVFKRPPAEPA